MAEVASAFVTLVPSARGFGSKISSELGPDMDKAGQQGGERLGTGVKGGFSKVGSTFGAVFGGFIAGGLAIAVGKISGFAKGAVDAFASLEDATGAAGVVFGDSLSIITGFADGAAEAFGISKGAAVDAANTFGTFGKAAGLGGDDLANFSVDLTGLAGDLASFKGTSTEQAIAAIGSALRGESEPIRAYGVLLDDATLRQEALGLGLIKTTKDALTPQQKVLAAQAAILKQTTDAQGDFARTSDSTANTQKRLAAATENAQAALGEKLAPAVTALRGVFLGLILGLGGAFDVFNSLGSVIGTVLAPAFAVLAPVASALFSAFQFALPVLLPLAAGVAAFALALSAGAIVTGIAGAATAAYAAITGGVAFVVNTARAAVLLFNLALAANPIGVVIALLVGLVAGLVIAYKSSETFRNIVNKAWESIKSVVFPIVEAFGKIVTTVFDFVKAYLTTVFAFYKALFTGDFGKMRDIVAGVFDKIKAVVTSIFDAVKGYLSGVLDSIKGAFSDAWTAVKDATSKAFEAIKTAISNGLDASVEFVKALPGRFVSALAALGGLLAGVATSAWSAFTTGIGTAFAATAEFVRGVPGKILSALGDLGSLLVNAGRQLMEGLARGIGEKIAAVVGKVRDAVGLIGRLLPGSPIKDGPLKSWNGGGAGLRLMDMLASGIVKGSPLVAGSLSDVLNVSSAVDTLARPLVPSPRIGSGDLVGSDPTSNTRLGGVTYRDCTIYTLDPDEWARQQVTRQRDAAVVYGLAGVTA